MNYIKPLAVRMRPKSINEMIGHEDIIGEDSIIDEMLMTGYFQSMILHGPPGSGKTTLARVLSKSLSEVSDSFESFEVNATSVSISDLRKVIKPNEGHDGSTTIPVVIIEEIHRINRDKQDVLLEGLEEGDFILIGTTTSNPLHAINPAIRSRVLLIELKPLTKEDLGKLIDKAMKQNYKDYTITNDAREFLISLASGDARVLLKSLETSALMNNNKTIDMKSIEKSHLSVGGDTASYGDGYHDTLSAFQKSIRGQDVNASLHYLAELLKAGDLDIICRRLMVTAYEDIGLANPQLCSRVVVGCQAVKEVGLPEAALILSPLVIELALSPHSREAYHAIHKAQNVIEKAYYQPPAYLKLTSLLNKVDKYDYSLQESWTDIAYLPEQIKDDNYYIPSSENGKRLASANKHFNNNRSYDMKKIKHDL